MVDFFPAAPLSFVRAISAPPPHCRLFLTTKYLRRDYRGDNSARQKTGTCQCEIIINRLLPLPAPRPRVVAR